MSQTDLPSSNGGGPNVISQCPECGAALEESLALYARDVVIVDGFIDQWEVAFGDDLERSVKYVTPAENPMVRVYCANDHELTAQLLNQ